MGRGISNFYIEGLNLLGGRYTLATKNLKANQVANVEVLNHHHKAKIDKNEHSDDVALNIRLTRNAKLKPIGNTDASLGVDSKVRYQAGAAAMMFMPSFQTILTLKTGNNHSFSEGMTADLINVRDFSTSLTEKAFGSIAADKPPLKADRYISPTDWLVSLNAIKKTGKNATLNIDADYSYAKRTYDYSIISRYFASGETSSISENMDYSGNQHKPKIQLTYNQDDDNRYLNNRMVLAADFADNNMATGTSNRNIRQHTNRNKINVRDNFNWKTRTGVAVWTVSSENKFTLAPADRFAVIGKDADEPTQTGESSDFSSVTTVGTRIEYQRSSLYLPFGMALGFNRFESDLSTKADVCSNNIDNMTVSPSFKPAYELRTNDRRLTLNVSLPFVMRHSATSYNGRKDKQTEWLLEPTLYANYALTPTSTFIFNSAITHQTGDLLDYMTSPVLTTWRSTSACSGVLSLSRTSSASVDYEYRRPLDFVFFNAGVAFSRTRNNLMPSQTIEGTEITSGFVRKGNDSDNAKASASVSKLIQPINTKIGLSASYVRTTGRMMQQEQTVAYTGEETSVGLNANVRPWTWFELNYSCDISNTLRRYLGTKSSFRSTAHEARVSVFPLSGLQLTGGCDYVKRRTDRSHTDDMALLDAAVQYKTKRFVVRLTADNLLDTKHYSYVIYSGLDRFAYDFRLRGRQIAVSFTLFR